MLLYFGFVLLAFLVGQSTCTDDGAPEAKKADYDVIMKNLIMHEDAKKYFKEGSNKLSMKKVNKTHTKIDGDCELLKDLPMDGFIEVLGYERDKNNHNAYLEKESFNVTRPVCEFMGNDKMIYPPLILASNFPVTCPVKKGNFHIKDYYMDMSNFPPNPPSDHWKFVVTLYEWASCSAPVCCKAEMYIELEHHKKKKGKEGKKKGDDGKEEKKEDKKEEKKDDSKEEDNNGGGSKKKKGGGGSKGERKGGKSKG